MEHETGRRQSDGLVCLSNGWAHKKVVRTCAAHRHGWLDVSAGHSTSSILIVLSHSPFVKIQTISLRILTNRQLCAILSLVWT